jgi:hypothetical protein
LAARCATPFSVGRSSVACFSLSLSLSLLFLVAGTTLSSKCCCCSKERSKRREEKRREEKRARHERRTQKTIQNRSKDVEERTYVLVVYC